MHRRSPIALYSMIIGLFVVMAVHVGIGDHSDHLMSPGVSAVAAMNIRSTMLDVDAHQTHPMAVAGDSAVSGPANDGQETGGGGMATICQLLVVATIVGIFVRVMIACRWSPGVIRQRATAFLRPTVSKLRPPGLTVLCVARC